MKNKNFIIIVIGQIISLFGNAVQRFSMSLYLLHFTGSTAAFAKILAISTIPYIIFAPIAGRLSDKINKKKIMIYLDLFCAALIGGYALILLNGRDSEFVVGAVMFILSICYTLYGPAVTSSIPQIVNEDRLTSANGIINQVGSAVNFVGPILAGVLYGLVGIKLIVIINALSFLMSAILELFLDIPDAESKTNNVIGKDKLSDENNSFICIREYFFSSYIINCCTILHKYLFRTTFRDLWNSRGHMCIRDDMWWFLDKYKTRNVFYEKSPLYICAYDFRCRFNVCYSIF